MYSWNAMLTHIAERLSEETGTKIGADELVSPPKPDMGDIAFGCFKLAKAQGKNPAEIAKELEVKFKKGDQTIETASAAGPYLNFQFKTGPFVGRVVHDVFEHGEGFGGSSFGKGQEVVVEYAQPNTHKEIHVGHLRNLVIGSSLVNLLRFTGWKTVAASYHGDVGAHVSKCLWFLVRLLSASEPQPEPKKVKKGETPAEKLSPDAWADFVLTNLDETMASRLLGLVSKDQRSGKYLGQLYAEANKVLEENPEWKDQVSEVQRRLESGDRAWNVIWQETRRWCVDEMARIFSEFGVAIDRQYFESEVVNEGQRIVDDLLSKGAARESQGAIVVDLEADKLGVFLVRKSDGTSLYATKDLALAKLKLKEHPKAARSLIVVDARQALYFKQLFRTLELMGVKVPHEFVGHEIVTLPDGVMSSRKGNVITLQVFRDEVLKFARAETRKRHPEWPEGQIEHTAWSLAMGGIKFSMLKQDSEKIFVFDLERALSFDGDTGPYVQYAATRLNAILKKAGWDEKKGMEADANVLSEPAEKRLALRIAAFPRVCEEAAKEMRPSLVAHWCVAMAQDANAFYRDVNVLESSFGVKQARLQLVAAARRALERGLALLGIPLPDEM